MEDPSTSTSTTSTSISKLLNDFTINLVRLADDQQHEELGDILDAEGAQVVDRIDAGKQNFVILVPRGTLKDPKKFAYIKKRSIATSYPLVKDDWVHESRKDKVLHDYLQFLWQDPAAAKSTGKRKARQESSERQNPGAIVNERFDEHESRLAALEEHRRKHQQAQPLLQQQISENEDESNRSLSLLRLFFRLQRIAKGRDLVRLFQDKCNLQYQAKTKTIKRFLSVWNKRKSHWRVLVSELLQQAPSLVTDPTTGMATLGDRWQQHCSSPPPDYLKAVELSSDQQNLFWSVSSIAVDDGSLTGGDEMARYHQVQQVPLTSAMRAVAELFIGTLLYEPDFEVTKDMIMSRQCKGVKIPKEGELLKTLDILTKNGPFDPNELNSAFAKVEGQPRKKVKNSSPASHISLPKTRKSPKKASDQPILPPCPPLDDKVRALLQQLKLDRFITLFEQAECTWEFLLLFEQSQLAALGLPPAPIQALLLALKPHKDNQTNM